MTCPFCDESNPANAKSVGSGSKEFRCDVGHVFEVDFENRAYRPIYTERGAETRIPLTTLQAIKG
jgi:hypothetical protein